MAVGVRRTPLHAPLEGPESAIAAPAAPQQRPSPAMAPPNEDQEN
jgi:hypothetical protein